MPLAVDHLLSAVSDFLVVSHGSSVGCPEGVHFNSVNLRNIAKWHPGKDTPNDTHYTVEYAM